MKTTTRCGVVVIEQLNARLLTAAVAAGVVDIEWLRADTTVSADIRYPTDSGLLVRGITKAAGLIGRTQAAGIAPRTVFDDSTAAAPQAAHRIGSKLRRRSDEAKAEVLAITGELVDLADTTIEQANACWPTRGGSRIGPVRRLRQMLADLEQLLDALAQIIARTRLRLAGETPPGKTRRVSLIDDDARPIRGGSLATPTQFGYTAQLTDNRQGIVIDYEIEAGMPPDAPRLVPAIERAITAVGVVPNAVTADHGDGESSVDDDLDKFGVDLVAILRKGKTSQTRQAIEADEDFVELVKMAHRFRGPDRRAEATARLGPGPHPRPRRRPRLRRALPQRHQDRRPHALTSRRDTTTTRHDPLTPLARTPLKLAPRPSQGPVARSPTATSSGASS